TRNRQIDVDERCVGRNSIVDHVERVAENPPDPDIGCIVRKCVQRRTMSVERIRVDEDAPEKSPPKPRSDSFVADDNFSAHADYPVHLMERTPYLSELVDATEMKGCVKGVVGERQ